MTEQKADITTDELMANDDDLDDIKIELPGITTHRRVPQRKLDYGKKNERNYG